jgi:hypothetical protein
MSSDKFYKAASVECGKCPANFIAYYDPEMGLKDAVCPICGESSVNPGSISQDAMVYFVFYKDNSTITSKIGVPGCWGSAKTAERKDGKCTHCGAPEITTLIPQKEMVMINSAQFCYNCGYPMKGAS